MNLQHLILTMAPRFEAREHVPILDAWSHPEEVPMLHDGTLLVWSGASDLTIYGDARVNYAFRAWHDRAHIAGRFGFTLAGERAACEWQIAEALRLFPRIPASVLRLIRAEVIGQAEHFAEHGTFPLDQVSFVKDYANILGGH